VSISKSKECVVNVLSEEKQSAITAAVCEGVSIRAAARLHNVHKNTILRLGLKVGEGCTALHGKLMKNLNVSRIELDEVWSFVKKKRRNVGVEDQIQLVTSSSTWRWTRRAKPF